MTILLVDDEKIILDVLTRELDWEVLGVDRVLSAQSVRQAMEIFLHERVDILVCDIEMPRESGLDLLRELQQNQIETVSILLTCLLYTSRSAKNGCRRAASADTSTV